MAAYVILKITVYDQQKLKEYQQVAPSIVEKYQGKFLARGGEIVTLEGPTENRRVVMIEFPNMESAKAFYHSEEYMAAIELRKDAAEFEIIAIDGLG